MQYNFTDILKTNRWLKKSYPEIKITLKKTKHLEHTYTGEGVAKLWVMDELAVIQHGHTVQMEAVQANDMAMHTLEHKHRTPVKNKIVRMMNEDWTEIHKKPHFKLLI